MAPRTHRSHSLARGFTLVELLVALVAMALMALMSWRGLDSMLRSQQYTQTYSDAHAVLQTTLAQWNADLDGLMALENTQAIAWNGQVCASLAALLPRPQKRGAGRRLDPPCEPRPGPVAALAVAASARAADGPTPGIKPRNGHATPATSSASTKPR